MHLLTIGKAIHHEHEIKQEDIQIICNSLENAMEGKHCYEKVHLLESLEGTVLHCKHHRLRNAIHTIAREIDDQSVKGTRWH